MKAKLFCLTIALAVTGLCDSAAFAFDPMGPPTAGQKGLGRAGIGMEYVWSQMDVEAEGISSLDTLTDTVQKFEVSKTYANIGLGMSDNSEIFLRVGVGDADPDRSDNTDNIGGYIGKSDQSFLLGGGAKFTLCKQENIKWGLLTQMSWADLDFDESSFSINGHSATLSTDADFYEYQIAVGPTVKLSDALSVYGGPFLHFIRGELKLHGTIDGSSSKITSDLEQEAILGGYVGLQLALGRNMDVSAEFQTTEAGYALGGSLRYKF
jgi:Outer membrane protein beta-barrel domain